MVGGVGEGGQEVQVLSAADEWCQDGAEICLCKVQHLICTPDKHGSTMSQCKIGDSCKDYSREAREGWPLLKLWWIGTQRVQMKGVLPIGWFVVLVVPVQEIIVCHGCSSRPRTKRIFLTVHFLSSFVPIAQQAGQAVVLGRLSLRYASLDYSAFMSG